MFVFLKSSKRHHNKSYDNENNKKSRKNPKNSVQKYKKRSKPFESKSFLCEL